MLELAPAGEVLVALLLLLLLFGAVQLLHALTDAFQGAPFPIDWIIGHLVSAQMAVVNRIKAWAVAGIDAGVAFLLATLDVPVRLFEHVVAALEAVVTLGRILRAAMTTLYHQALGYTRLVADGIAASVIATTHWLEARIAQVQALAVDGIDALRTDLADTAASIEHTVAADAAALGGAIDQATHDLASALVAAEADSARALSTAVHAIDGAIEGAVTTVARDLSGAIDGVEKTLLDRIGAVEAAGGLALGAAVAALLHWVQAGVMATVATMQGELDQCVRPNCGWMQSLGTDLRSLAGDLETIALLAFLAEAVVEPGAAAAQVETVVNPIADGIYAALAPVLGLVERATGALFGGARAA